MCCFPGGHGHWMGWCHGLGFVRPFPRRFLSKKEEITQLDDYRKDLEQELAEVKRRIEELKAGK